MNKPNETKREKVRALILANVADLVSELLYYDRKEDEDLTREALDEAIEEGWITLDDVAFHFAKHLREEWPR